MKRDMDLIRQILICFEEKADFQMVRDRDVRIDGYDERITSYHVHLLCEAGFLSCERETSSTTHDRLINAHPFRLTWEGHEFLDAVRDESRWKRMRASLGKLGEGVPVAVVKSLAIAIVKEELGLS